MILWDRTNYNKRLIVNGERNRCVSVATSTRFDHVQNYVTKQTCWPLTCLQIYASDGKTQVGVITKECMTLNIKELLTVADNFTISCKFIFADCACMWCVCTRACVCARARVCVPVYGVCIHVWAHVHTCLSVYWYVCGRVYMFWEYAFVHETSACLCVCMPACNDRRFILTDTQMKNGTIHREIIDVSLCVKQVVFYLILPMMW